MGTPSVLFVCLGNICRSPTAEGVFKHKAMQNGFDVKVDSAGTAGYHDGHAPDKRSQQVASNKGYDLSRLKCRKVTEADFNDEGVVKLSMGKKKHALLKPQG